MEEERTVRQNRLALRPLKFSPNSHKLEPVARTARDIKVAHKNKTPFAYRQTHAHSDTGIYKHIRIQAKKIKKIN